MQKMNVNGLSYIRSSLLLSQKSRKTCSLLSSNGGAQGKDESRLPKFPLLPGSIPWVAC